MVKIPPVTPLRVNLGSGQFGFDGWVNVDWDLKIRWHRWLGLAGALRSLHVMSQATYDMYRAVKVPPNFLAWNFGKRPLPFATGSAEVLYTSHVLEHFPRWQAEAILREACRVLRPGGLIRVIVPDLEVLCRRYLISRGEPAGPLPEAQQKPMDDREFNSVFYTKDHVVQVKSSLDMRIAGLFPHMYIFDFDDMAALLTAAGFLHPRKLAFRQGRCPELERLDNNPDVSLYVEAEKPGGSTSPPPPPPPSRA